MTHATFVAAVRLVCIVVDASWAIYLIAIPAERLASNNTWAAALRVVPWHDQVLFGLAFLVGPLLAAFAAVLPHEHGLERIAYALAVGGLAVAASCWGLASVSFTFAAAAAGWLGTAAAVASGGYCAFHVLLAFTYHRRTGRR